MYFFPKHVLCGCISGIGVFVVTTGLEVSKGIGKLEWTSLESIEEFFGSQVRSCDESLITSSITLKQF